LTIPQAVAMILMILIRDPMTTELIQKTIRVGSIMLIIDIGTEILSKT
jgi:hypothetical protein